MSDLRVQRIRSIDGNTVELVDGLSGNADGLRFEPKIISYNPTPLSVDVNIATSQFVFTFDQPIEFSGVGTIFIREGSPTGTVYESFTCGVSAGATIAGETLVVNTSQGNFTGSTNYVITLPSVGIANTYGQYYKGSDGYTFSTNVTGFDVIGGDYSQVIADGNSPTGFYKYNIFTSSGIATFTGPVSTATNFSYVLVGGGGGGGWANEYSQGTMGGGGGAGGLVKDYSKNSILAGTYTVTIGAGGPGTRYNENPYNQPTPLTPNWSTETQPGGDSSFGPTPVGTITAFGGGGAGLNAYGYPTPTRFYPITPLNEYRGGKSGGSGGGATVNANVPSPIPYIPGNPTIISGGSANGYPGPNQQGYPGGNCNTSPHPVQSFVGGGGGGAGSAGISMNGRPTPIGQSNEFALPGTSGVGGNGQANPEFTGSNISLINGIPSNLYNAMGPTGLLAGGGGGGVYAPSDSAYYYPVPYPRGDPRNFTPTTAGVGGPGGGGDGCYYHPSPPGGTYNQFANRYSEAGVENTGGGGGGGQMDPNTPAPPTQPGSKWFGAPGGSGVMMIRYAHPGG